MRSPAPTPTTPAGFASKGSATSSTTTTTRTTIPTSARPRGPAGPGPWDARVEQHIRALPPSELADLACDLVRRLPDAYDALRDRITLREGGADRLIADTRAEIAAVTAEPGWNRHWTDEGYTPDFHRVAVRFERLLELGQADAVVGLARDYIAQAQAILEISDDEGETIQAFAATLPVVFAAVAQSSLAAPDRILFVVDADLDDQYDAIGPAGEVVLDACTDPAAWSAVADTLSRRLETERRSAGPGPEFLATPRREQIVDWAARALIETDRLADLEALYEAEARAAGGYRRLVDYLIEADRLDDAEAWAVAGTVATAAAHPGLAENLTATLAEIARRRERWDLVAAHAARSFFDRPAAASFAALIEAARPAGVEPAVRAAAIHFLETSAAPWHRLAPGTKPSPPKERRSVGSIRLAVDPAWPLPIPDYFLHLMGRPGQDDPAAGPRFDVLLDMALAAGDADEILRRYDQLRAHPPRNWYGGVAYDDRVAAAVAAHHPARSLEIYRSKLDALLPRADQGAYAAATEYLKVLRPIYAALDRAAEWDDLLASIRSRSKNRPRFMELLATLDGRTLPHAAKPRRR